MVGAAAQAVLALVLLGAMVAEIIVDNALHACGRSHAARMWLPQFCARAKKKQKKQKKKKKKNWRKERRKEG